MIELSNRTTDSFSTLNHVFAATTDDGLVTRLRSPGIQSMIGGKQTEAIAALEKPGVKESHLIC
jgi:hypothetical protein